MSQLPEFVHYEGRTALHAICEATGDEALFGVKYHPELMPIELCWAPSKRFCRTVANGYIDRLRGAVPVALKRLCHEVGRRSWSHVFLTCAAYRVLDLYTDVSIFLKHASHRNHLHPDVNAKAILDKVPGNIDFNAVKNSVDCHCDQCQKRPSCCTAPMCPSHSKFASADDATWLTLVKEANRDQVERASRATSLATQLDSGKAAMDLDSLVSAFFAEELGGADPSLPQIHAQELDKIALDLGLSLTQPICHIPTAKDIRTLLKKPLLDLFQTVSDPRYAQSAPIGKAAGLVPNLKTLWADVRATAESDLVFTFARRVNDYLRKHLLAVQS